MPAQQQIDREVFLARLRESGLCSAEQLAEIRELAAGTAQGRAVAKLLVERGILTRFQAELLLAGRTDGFVLGQYRILDEIGRGGMGRVFKAEHQTMHRIVALKVLANNLTKSERNRQLFQREVRAAARLIHPNIVTAYDANQSGDRHYLVMEFVDGPNLQELVFERGPLPVGQACDFIRQAALGLQCAANLGMVHRDIKPANLLLQRAGNQYVVKILDFGLARLHEPPTEVRQSAGQDSIPAAEQAVMGTPDYLSPEQAKNLHNVDIRSDLYSLGCTMYYLLTGQVPFSGGTSLEKLVRHASEQAPFVHLLRPEVPIEVSAIVARLMAKDPDQRFQTPMELVKALEPFSDPAGDLPTLAAPQAISESPWASLLDDDPQAAHSTLPPQQTALTPISTGVTPNRLAHILKPKTRRRSLVESLLRLVTPFHKKWWIVAAVAGALLLGFLLGALALIIALKK